MGGSTHKTGIGVGEALHGDSKVHCGVTFAEAKGSAKDV